MPFWKRKQTSRGPYRTASQRVAEAKAKVEEVKHRTDEILLKTWLTDLQSHPEYCRQVAREKYGMPAPETDYSAEGTEPPDLLAVLKEAKQIKELVKDEIQPPSNWAVVADILRSLPEVLQVLPQLAQPQTQEAIQQTMQTARTLSQPQPVPKAIPSEKQRELADFTNRFLELEPELAAKELYEHRTAEGTLRSIAWNSLVEVSSVEDALAAIHLIDTLPQPYHFLKAHAQRLSTGRGRQWLSLLLDEVHRLNRGENESKNEGNPAETSDSGGETGELKG